MITMKVLPRALRLFRLIAASTGEKQYEAVLRLAEAEAAKLALTGKKKV